MESAKLNKWAELLLDTGRRNPLIHFKDTKSSTAEVLIPDMYRLFDKIDHGISFEVCAPAEDEETADDVKDIQAEAQDIPEEEQKEADVAAPEEEQKQAHSEEAIRDVREIYRQKYASNIKKQNQMLLYHTGNLNNVMLNLWQRAKSFVEETGVGVTYLAFGFVHWTEAEYAGHTYCAPLLLAPVRIERESAAAPYMICPTGDDIVVNPTFSYKMKAEYGFGLPDYEDEPLESYVQKTAALVARLKWAVSSECKLGIFSFLKINMYQDLKEHARLILAHPNIRRLLGEAPEDGIYSGVSEKNRVSSEQNRSKPALHNVVDADSSQIEAIEMAKSGESFVLQGPPGTGKSQTITNIIAECLMDGKRVLFVSEKLAALNVVYDKLKKAGLSEFCLELHSHKANKKEVIADLCHTLRKNKSAVSLRANDEIAAMEKVQRQLDAYAAQLHCPRAVIKKSLYQLYEACAAVRKYPDIECVWPDIDAKDETNLSDAVWLIEQYVGYIPSTGYDYRQNPWYGFCRQDISYAAKMHLNTEIPEILTFLGALWPISEEMREAYGIACINKDDADIWRTFFQFAASVQINVPELLKKENFEAAEKILKQLISARKDVMACREEIEGSFEEGIYQIDGKDVYDRLTKLFGSPLSRLFNQEYKKIAADFRLCKKDGKKVPYSQMVHTAKVLSDYRQKMTEFETLAGHIEHLLGGAYHGTDTDWETVSSQMVFIRTLMAADIDFGRLPEYSFDLFVQEKERMLQLTSKLDECSKLCTEAYERIAEAFDPDIFDLKTAGISESVEKLEGCLSAKDELDDWCRVRTVLRQLKDENILKLLNQMIDQNIEPAAMTGVIRKKFYSQWIDAIIFSTPVLADFNRTAQDRAVEVFAEKDRQQFEINKARIRAAVSAERPSLDMIASGSALAMLLREGEKKRRQKSIRSILSSAGELVQRIKPCFLMSPLSVSTFLDPKVIHFDVVVFDEASQIFPQDAVGAVYRADQMIVVGDSKQMPPSNFFNAAVQTEDMDDDGSDAADFESILDLCSASMRQLRLRWHYRSRCEQLIAFSNKNFYDNELVTFPAARADSLGQGIDYYYADGTFERKSHTNRKEAAYVVDLIYENIEKYPDRSLGVIAFSVAQQNMIDRLLMKRRKECPEKEFFFKSDVKEPFFIKNLETVQGDERDTIIFSVAYGPDSQGRLLHNFGPLNRAGGERRLNVAVTRAKQNVQLVSSMHYTDIDLSRTSSEGARLLREYLDYAENGEIALERSVSVNPFERYDSDFEAEVCEFLRSGGFCADTQIGCSGFRIDIGLRRPDSSDYVLAIECDGASYHSSKNARDRDRLRQEILEHMGWKFYRIWSTEWFRSKAAEQERLIEACKRALSAEDTADMENDAEENDETMPAQTEPAEDFEETAAVEPFVFPDYKMIDIDQMWRNYFPDRYVHMVKEILKVEAPLSEEWLLKRTAPFFGREKVTSVVQNAYEKAMAGCEGIGIIRRNGFLYLEQDNPIFFRASGSQVREVRYICLEELASGMMEILRQNVTADKDGLYNALAKQCGLTRAGKAAAQRFDEAFKLLEDQVKIEGENISVK